MTSTYVAQDTPVQQRIGEKSFHACASCRETRGAVTMVLERVIPTPGPPPSSLRNQA